LSKAASSKSSSESKAPPTSSSSATASTTPPAPHSLSTPETRTCRLLKSQTTPSKENSHNSEKAQVLKHSEKDTEKDRRIQELEAELAVCRVENEKMAETL